MKYLLYRYRGKSRELRKMILAILKSKNANEVQKVNYSQIFCMDDKSVKKSEAKILLINTDSEEALNQFISQNFPQIERIHIN